MEITEGWLGWANDLTAHPINCACFASISAWTSFGAKNVWFFRLPGTCERVLPSRKHRNLHLPSRVGNLHLPSQASGLRPPHSTLANRPRPQRAPAPAHPGTRPLSPALPARHPPAHAASPGARTPGTRPPSAASRLPERQPAAPVPPGERSRARTTVDAARAPRPQRAGCPGASPPPPPPAPVTSSPPPKSGIPPRYDLDDKWDACLDLSIRRVTYYSLAGAFAGLLFHNVRCCNIYCLNS
ncbi:hypothetical protein BDA96_07G141900 [Sorghum bicolor]|uniref:Uncharacterized protein n=1 Tax=Sorghum bicolor TaxID=4558 RepID=A0A921QKN6_SORBI|nr:hypothetical protein BDA96_07G141900 [Sorghum bicolor]